MCAGVVAAETVRECVSLLLFLFVEKMKSTHMLIISVFAQKDVSISWVAVILSLHAQHMLISMESTVSAKQVTSCKMDNVTLYKLPSLPAQSIASSMVSHVSVKIITIKSDQDSVESVPQDPFGMATNVVTRKLVSLVVW